MAPTSSPAVSVKPERDASPVRILLVDDDEANLLSLSATLEVLGQELVLARSGEEALREILGQDFAAIQLDVNIPAIHQLEPPAMIPHPHRSNNTPIHSFHGFPHY